jgi:hypothetical protein
MNKLRGFEMQLGEDFVVTTVVAIIIFLAIVCIVFVVEKRKIHYGLTD